MNRRIAAFHLARRYPDWDSLAAHMKKRPDTLRKELTGVEGYKWGVDDEELLIALCIGAGVLDPLGPLTAAALNAGALLLPLPQNLQEDGPTFKCLAEAAQEFGLFMSTLSAAVADGNVTANELKEGELEFSKLVAKGQACMANLTAIHEAGKPKAHKAADVA